MSAVSTLTVFRIDYQDPRFTNLFANGRNQFPLTIRITKQVQEPGEDMFLNVPLSNTERQSIHLIREDGRDMGPWRTTVTRDANFRLAGQGSLPVTQFSSTDVAEEVMAESADGLNSERDAEQVEALDSEVDSPFNTIFPETFTHFLTTTSAETVRWLARITLDIPDSSGNRVVTVSSNLALPVTSVPPLLIHAHSLHQERQKHWDERVFWDSIFWWSLHSTYWRFPSWAPPMRPGNIFSGGLILHSRPFLTFSSGGRRVADVINNNNRHDYNTYDVRRGFSNRWYANINNFRLRNGWAFRVIQYYENPMDVGARHSPVTVSFVDVYGNDHRYSISITGGHNINVIRV